MKKTLSVTAPGGTFSGTWSGGSTTQTHTQTGQMGAGTTYGRPQKAASAADSK